MLKDLTYEEKKTKALIEKMKNDKTVTYRTVYGDSYASASKDYRKGLDDKYGKAKYAGSYQATNVTGTNYKVRGANTRAGRSRKYNDSKYKQDRDVQLVRQQYYYY